MRRALDRLLLVLIGSAVPLGAIFGCLIVSYHRDLTRGRLPIGVFRYARGPGFELTPGFSARMLDGTFFVRTHGLGYRIPENADARNVSSGGVLATGCSFTFGDEVEAQDTFAYRLGEKLGLPSYNFGVPAYSLASVIRQLETLRERGVLDQLAPSVVVLGIGDWLVERSLNPFVPSEDMQYAYPYIAEVGGGGHEDGDRGTGAASGGTGRRLAVVDPPAWASIEHKFTFAGLYFPEGTRNVRLTPRRMWLLGREIPRVLRANFDGNRTRKKLLRQLPFPTVELYDFVLAEVEKNFAPQVVLVVLALTIDPARPIDSGLVAAVRRHPRFRLVDGARALREAKVPAEAYCCGRHPGPAAHEAYAAALARTLNDLGGAGR